MWGQFEQPTVLHGAWSAAMFLCMDGTETGALVSFGRLSNANYKEVALLSSSTTVTLSSSLAGTSLYYTLDGTTPSASNGTLYTGPFAFKPSTATTTLKVVAVKSGWMDSAPAEIVLTDTNGNILEEFVEYVQSTGTQYVDTGVIGKAGTYAEMGMFWTARTGQYLTFLGARADMANFLLCHVQNWTSKQNGYFFCGYGTVGSTNTTLPRVTAGTYFDVKTEISTDGLWTSTVNGNTFTTNLAAQGSVDTQLNMWVFSRNYDSVTNLSSSARCWYLRIWQDNNGTSELKRYYRPCVKYGRAALYDEVSQTIFYSVSGTDLVAGPEYDMLPSAYVLAYGTNAVRTTGNAIDTGYKATKTTTFKVDYQVTCTDATMNQGRIFGARGNFGAAHYVSGTGQFAFNMGSTQTGHWKPLSVNADTDRHWFTLAPASKGFTGTLYGADRTTVLKTVNDSSATSDKTATLNIHLFAEKLDASRVQGFGHAKIYSFIAETGGAPAAFFAPTRNPTTGRAGFQNIIDGSFHGEANTSSIAPLLFIDGIGTADDYKYEGGTLYAKVYLKTADATLGLVKIGEGTAAATTNDWLAYGGTLTVSAVPAEGYVLDRWEGDTWAITSGSAKSKTIMVKSDTAIQLKAVFKKKKKGAMLIVN